MLKRSVLIVFLMLSATACDNTTARYSSDLAHKLGHSDILILPPNAEAYKVDAGGTSVRQYDYEGHIEPILATELQKKLEEKGYHATILHKKDLMKNKTYKEYDALKQSIKTAYEDAKTGTPMERKKAKNSKMNLNGKARDLTKKLNAPVLAYIEYNETLSTSDAQVASFIAAVAIQALTGVNTSTPPDTARIIVALIDGKDDKVLWANPGGSAGGGVIDGMINTEEEQSLNHIDGSIDWALKELPKREDLSKNEAPDKED